MAEIAPGITLAGSLGLNVFNAETVRALGGLSFSCSCSRRNYLPVRSPSLPVRRGRRGWTELAVFAQGNLETMVTEDCLIIPSGLCGKGAGPCSRDQWYGIRDETGHLLPVRIDGESRAISSMPPKPALSMLSPELVRIGVDAMVIDARGRTPGYAGEMVRITGMPSRVQQNLPPVLPAGTATSGTAKVIALGEITAGHYTRGVREESYKKIHHGNERLNGAGGKHLKNEE